MTDSIFVEDSPILRWFHMRQQEIKKDHSERSDKKRFSKPTGLEMFL